MSGFKELKQIGKEQEQLDSSKLDPRTNLLVFLMYVIFVVSVNKYDIAHLLLYISFPVFYVTAMGIPIKMIFKRFLIVSPFILMLGIFNPFLDTEPVWNLYGGYHVTGGMISFAVIAIKGFLSVLAIMILTRKVPFYELCGAMSKLKVPRVFVVQLLFLYRYLFVMADEAHIMQKARDLRAFSAWGRGIRMSSRLLGTLFIRTVDRSQRIYKSMLSRGFTGEIVMNSQSRMTWRDGVFMVGALGLFILFRMDVIV